MWYTLLINKTIVKFIDDFNNHAKDNTFKSYKQGYCWHFAHMLNNLFVGEVCWCAPFSHFIFVSEGVGYDIDGVYYGEADYLIPESWLGNLVDDFKQIESISANATKEQINDVIFRYKKSKGYK